MRVKGDHLVQTQQFIDLPRGGAPENRFSVKYKLKYKEVVWMVFTIVLFGHFLLLSRQLRQRQWHPIFPLSLFFYYLFSK
jgi:hypothetical protein